FSAALGPRCTATSASCTWAASRSASLYTPTERIPSRRSVRITRTAISPRLATRTVSNKLIGPLLPALRSGAGDASASHPENPVRHRIQRCVRRDRQRQPEHIACLPGVDHPVVPDAGGRVVRVPLVLVLVPDGLLELLLIPGGPVLAALLHL